MRAILKNGVFYPKERIPPEWSDGTEFEVAQASPTDDDSDLDRWYAELEAGCAQLDPEDDRTLREAIQEVRAEEKELARRQAALEE
jgi:hypothetical protein